MFAAGARHGSRHPTRLLQQGNSLAHALCQVAVLHEALRHGASCPRGSCPVPPPPLNLHCTPYRSLKTLECSVVPVLGLHGDYGLLDSTKVAIIACRLFPEHGCITITVNPLHSCSNNNVPIRRSQFMAVCVCRLCTFSRFEPGCHFLLHPIAMWSLYAVPCTRIMTIWSPIAHLLVGTMAKGAGGCAGVATA